MPEVVVRGDSLAFFPLDAPGGHFELPQVIRLPYIQILDEKDVQKQDSTELLKNPKQSRMMS